MKKIIFFFLFFLNFFLFVWAQGQESILSSVLCILIERAVFLFNLMLKLAPILIVFFVVLFIVIKTVPFGDINMTQEIKRILSQAGKVIFWIYCGFLILFFILHTMGVISVFGVFTKEKFEIPCQLP